MSTGVSFLPPVAPHSPEGSLRAVHTLGATERYRLDQVSDEALHVEVKSFKGIPGGGLGAASLALGAFVTSAAFGRRRRKTKQGDQS